MSAQGVPGTVGRPGWSLPRAPGTRKAHEPAWFERIRVPQVALRAIPFFMLAFFATAHWVALIQPVQVRRAFVASLVATLGGVLISLSGRLPRLPGIVVRIALVVVTTVIAVTAIGIRFKLLMPAGWGTLSDRIDGGLAVIGSVGEWPYSGPNVWLRLTTLLAAPLGLVLAAALTFWPTARSAPRSIALVLLVTIYGVAVAARPFEAQALRGVGLLACLAAWLWMPRLRGRDARMACAAIAVVGLVALALTPRLASSQPWVDYRHWSWNLHSEKTITYDWRHSYGTLHWPRKGTTLLLIRAKHSRYWKAETLDRFDGRRWTTTPAVDSDPGFANTEVVQNPKWVETVHVTVRGLRSQLVVGPGDLLSVQGLHDQSVPVSNGTLVLNGEISSGDSYTARGYAPDPTAKQMRAAPPPDQLLGRYTTLSLSQTGGFTANVLHVPLSRTPGTGDPDAATQLESSRYARVYDLAKQITLGAKTDYDKVSRIGAWLEGHMQYSERVPSSQYPIETFLFKSKVGYCQHFSGAAALMLRMLGIPTRIASGFAPGTKDKDTHEYVIRDLDAHSWIEVWFQGIGWVPFDPTPAQAPASSQAASFTPLSEIASAARGDNKDRLSKRTLDALIKAGGGGTPSASSSAKGGTPWGWILLGAIVALLGIAALVVSLLRFRRRRQPPPPCGDPEVDHLVRLLTRLGLDIAPGTTLLEIEKRMERLGGPEAAGYAGRLRRRRFAGDGDPVPDRAERRKLRQTLAEAVGAGPLARVHLAMPDNLRVSNPFR